MLKKITDMIFIKKLDREIEKKMDLDNLKFLRMVSLCVAMIEGIMLIQYGYFGDRANEWYSLRVWCYSIYFLLNALCFALTMTVLDHPDRHWLLMFVGLFYCTVSVLWGMVISATDYIGGSQAFVFITIIVCVSGFAFMKPVISIPFFTLLFAIFYCVLIFVCNADRSVPTNYLILLLMIVWTNVTRYQTKLSDATARVEYERLNLKLEKMSLQDELTKAKNRHSLSLDAPGFIDKSLFLTMVDIDNFKSMNDTYGHDYGDWLLKQFTQILQKHYLPQNVYRYGGDEFIIAVCDGRMDELIAKVKRVQADVASIPQENGSISVTFSGGYIVSKPKNPDDFNTMINCIDKALYQSKRNGKNQIHCAESMDDIQPCGA